MQIKRRWFVYKRKLGKKNVAGKRFSHWPFITEGKARAMVRSFNLDDNNYIYKREEVAG